MTTSVGDKLAQAFRDGFSGQTRPKTSGRMTSGAEIEATKAWPAKKHLWPGVVGIVAIGLALSTIGRPSEEEQASDRSAGFHCLSKWDGSHDDVVKLVKRGLREPSSFEHIETRVTPIKANGQHGLIMEYRARNGFGGANVQTATATYRNNDCAVVDWTAS